MAMKWTTRASETLYVFEMSDKHIENAINYTKRRIARREYLFAHACPVDILDGPCGDCHLEEEERDKWQHSIEGLQEEQRRRIAEQKRTEARG